MGIGTSLGAYYETDLDHHAGNQYLLEPNSTPDNNELSTNEVMPKPDEEPKIVEIANLTNTPGEILEGLEGTRVFPQGYSSRGGPTAQMRRNANDNKEGVHDSAGNLMSSFDIDKAWANFGRGQDIINQRTTLMDKMRDTGLNDLEKQKLKNLDKQHADHFTGRPD